MKTILQLNQDELRAEIKNCLLETIEEIKSIPTPEPPPDRMTLKEACQLTGLSKSQLYKLSMLDEIPRSYYGKRLEFSRKSLLEWMKDRTTTAPSASDIMDNRLSKSAKRQIK